MVENASPRRVTWGRCAVIVLAVLIAGQGLAIARPVWFAPPLVMFTPLLYLFLALAWLPALIVCALRRPAGNARRWLFRLGVVGGLATAFWFTLMSPGMAWALLDTAHVTCASDALSGTSLVRHTCTHRVPSRVETVILEGPPGSPFAWLVDTEYSGS